MGNVVLLTVKDLTVRWQKDERTIRRYIADGVLVPCKGVPGIMFHPKYISELEGIELEKRSEFEFRTLERENANLKRENEELKNIIRELQVISAKSLALLA